MVNALLPPRQCRWCENDLAAGEMFCRACGGTRLAPARWWPVTAASLLLLACALGAMVSLMVSIWIMDRAAATPVLPATADQAALPSPTVPATPPLGQMFSPAQPPVLTPATGGAEAPRAEKAATLAPMATQTPTFAPTATQTPIPQPTATQTPVPQPTATQAPAPVPTATPTPVPVPQVPDPRLRADQTTIGAGGCTFLHWDVDGPRAVYLDGKGRPGHSTEKVCPIRSHTYVLKLVMPNGDEKSFPLEVRVVGVLPLTLNVLVTKVSCDTTESYAAEIAIWASGGDGWYTYYQDDPERYIGGPTEGGMVYTVSWRTCGGMPGTFVVRSGDGQEAREVFWVEPPECCGKGP